MSGRKNKKTIKDKDKDKNEKKGIMRNKNIIALVLFVLIALILIYILSPKVRFFVDENIFRKYVKEENAAEVYINSQNNPKIIAYDKNIAVLERGELTVYTKKGEQINTNEKLNISMANPLVKVNGKNLVLVEKNGKKIFLINDDQIIWNRELDFNINNVNINSNGYIVVIGSNNMYKSIVAVINNEGEELFIMYISSNIVVDAEISSDNKTLVIAEVNYSKPIIESILKYISVDKAIKSPDESLIKTYKQNKLIIDIKFRTKDVLLARYSKEIYKYSLESEEKIYNISENTQFVDISSNNNIIVLEQVDEGIFSGEYQITIINNNGNTKALYKIGKFVPKELKLTNNNIGVNLGQEAVILGINGWEKKNYNTNKEIREIILSDKICVILYKNSFRIIDF